MEIFRSSFLLLESAAMAEELIEFLRSSAVTGSPRHKAAMYPHAE